MDTLNSTHPLKDIDILEGLASFPGGATLSRICESTELNKSTALRLLKALTDRGYVIRDEATKMYRLSYKVLALSSAVLDTIEIKKIARNYLKEISGITNETIHLLCKEGTEAIYIDKIDTPNTIGLKSQIGRHIPLYCTSGGKVLLAYSNVEYKLRFFSDVSLIQFTENTITQKDKLLAELERIKENGYALDDEEHHDNITCVAVPIFNVNGDVEYSVSVAAPSYRFSKTMAMSYVPALKKCAQQISEKLSILEVK